MITALSGGFRGIFQFSLPVTWDGSLDPAFEVEDPTNPGTWIAPTSTLTGAGVVSAIVYGYAHPIPTGNLWRVLTAPASIAVPPGVVTPASGTL